MKNLKTKEQLFEAEQKPKITDDGMGQNGTQQAKKDAIKKMSEDLHHPAFYAEVSDNLAKFISKDIKYVNNKEEVEKVLSKKVEWVGKREGYEQAGWYKRDIHGTERTKLLIGQPKA